MSQKQDTPSITLADRIQFGLIRFLLGLMHLLPYAPRVRFMGWMVQRVIGPLVGYNKRSRVNLEMIFPDMPAAERAAIAGQASNNVGRVLAEMFSPKDFVASARHSKVSGAGLPHLEQAKAEGRPIIFLSAHYGNYESLRIVMNERGFEIGGLFRKMDNPLFHDFYVKNMLSMGEPMFQRGRAGLGQMLRHFRKGGSLAALIDVRAGEGEALNFFGHPAMTALSLAELALKNNALVVPCYAMRQADGLSFEGIFEEPIPLTDPKTMTQAYNDSLEAQVRKDLGQWFWIHRRWKDAA